MAKRLRVVDVFKNLKENKHISALSPSALADYIPRKPYLKCILKPYESKIRIAYALNSKDKTLQRLILRHIQGRVIPLLQPTVFGSKGTSVDGITNVVKAAFKQKKRYALRLDIRNCFNEIDHALLEQRLKDSGLFTPRFVRLLGNQTWQYFKAHKKGIPQGYPLSSLLLNLFLMPFDAQLSKQGYLYYRYADDIALFFESPDEAKAAFKTIKGYLASLKQSLNIKKCRLSRIERTSLLG